MEGFIQALFYIGAVVMSFITVYYWLIIGYVLILNFREVIEGGFTNLMFKAILHFVFISGSVFVISRLVGNLFSIYVPLHIWAYTVQIPVELLLFSILTIIGSLIFHSASSQLGGFLYTFVIGFSDILEIQGAFYLFFHYLVSLFLPIVALRLFEYSRVYNWEFILLDDVDIQDINTIEHLIRNRHPYLKIQKQFKFSWIGKINPTEGRMKRILFSFSPVITFLTFSKTNWIFPKTLFTWKILLNSRNLPPIFPYPSEPVYSSILVDYLFLSNSTLKVILTGINGKIGIFIAEQTSTKTFISERSWKLAKSLLNDLKENGFHATYYLIFHNPYFEYGQKVPREWNIIYMEYTDFDDLEIIRLFYRFYLFGKLDELKQLREFKLSVWTLLVIFLSRILTYILS